MKDKATDGTIVDVTAKYTGKKEPLNIDEVPVDTPKIIGYYNILGQKLDNEPPSGIYIVVFDNGKSEKVMKKRK